MIDWSSATALMENFSIPDWARPHRARHTKRRSAMRRRRALSRTQRGGSMNGLPSGWQDTDNRATPTCSTVLMVTGFKLTNARLPRAESLPYTRTSRRSSGPKQEIGVAKRKLELVNELVTEKNQALEVLSKKLSKYLSPQVYSSIFLAATQDVKIASSRKKLTVFFSDIADFTATTDDSGIRRAHWSAQSLLDGDVEDRAGTWRDDRQVHWRCDPGVLWRPGDQGGPRGRNGLRQHGHRDAAADARVAGRMARQGIAEAVPTSDRHQHRLLHGRQFRQ